MSHLSYETRAQELFLEVFNLLQFRGYKQNVPTLHCVTGGGDLLGIGPLVWLDADGRVCIDIQRCFTRVEEENLKNEPLYLLVLNEQREQEQIGPIKRGTLLALTNPEYAPVIALRSKFQTHEQPVTELRIRAELSQALGTLFLRRKLQESPDSWFARSTFDATLLRRGIEQHFYFMQEKSFEQVDETAFERFETDRGGDDWLLTKGAVLLVQACLTNYGGSAIAWFIANRPYNPEQSRIAHLPSYIRRAEEALADVM